MYDIGIKDLVKTMDETKLLNYLKGESDAEECLEVEAWYHASAEHKKQLDQLYYPKIRKQSQWQSQLQ